MTENEKSLKIFKEFCIEGTDTAKNRKCFLGYQALIKTHFRSWRTKGSKARKC